MSLKHSTLLVMLLPLVAGCSGCTDSSTTHGPSTGESTDRLVDELFTYAIENLNRLEEFESGAMLQQIVKGVFETEVPEQRDPLMQTWPQPEMLRQIIDRLNQWIRAQKNLPEWTIDPLVGTLPDELQELPQVKDLAEPEFTRFDGFALREVVWLRDVSTWARGDVFNDLDRAKKLFDWTVRNIQLQGETTEAENAQSAWIPQVPWEALLFGRGTAMERAWVFLLLARQQGLDAAVLAVAQKPAESSSEEEPPPDAQRSPKPWVVSVLIDGELYLFDPALGLPIPGPDGVRLDEGGQLEIRPATLAEVVADDVLLRRLDLDESTPYPVTSADLQHVVALVEASPTYLAGRMRLLESRLVGKQKMVLSIDATAQAGRFAGNEHVAEAKLWTLPYETLAARSQLTAEQVGERLAALLPFYAIPEAPLRKARMLYFKGKFQGPQGATVLLQQSRPPNRALEAAEIRPEEKSIYLHAKQNASYWLGLIAFEHANYSSAEDYFGRRTLAAVRGGPWTPGAMYNLARTFAALGEAEKAIELYRATDGLPGYHGNALRARWLEDLQPAPEPPPPEPEITEPPIEEPAS